MSVAKAKMSELNVIARFVIKLFKILKVAYVNEYTENGILYIEFNNLTLINFVLKVLGPLHERSLTCILLGFQIVCSCMAFAIRYRLALFFYGEVVA